ncbi:MAG TPA: DUF6671 family protein [Jatrophihabitans sp.]|nr:DUF6671 family protein [Jatrophihabitans sp.]
MKDGVTAAYAGQWLALGTRHGKQRQLQPAFAARLGARLTVPRRLDTDQFGTFSGERPRTLSAPAAAAAKARLAMQATGLPFGVASEASYGPLPDVGWPGHEELLIFIDATRGIQVLEGLRVLDMPAPGQRVRSAEEVRLERWLWPAQRLIVRPATSTVSPVVKGVANRATLRAAVARAARADPAGLAVVEPDLRAHANPSRRRVLRLLAARLAERLRVACPACACPGFGRTDVERGLPCQDCGSATDQVRAELHSCPRCEHLLRVPRAVPHGDPRWCPQCNP